MDYIELKPGEWKHIPKKTIFDSGALGPCICALLYRPRIREAYAGHFEDCKRQGLDKMIDTALTRGKAHTFDVYVAGGGRDGSDSPTTKLILKDREYVTALLGEKGFDPDRTCIRWGPVDSSSILKFNMVKGTNLLRIRTRKTVYKGDMRTAPLFF